MFGVERGLIYCFFFLVFFYLNQIYLGLYFWVSLFINLGSHVVKLKTQPIGKSNSKF